MLNWRVIRKMALLTLAALGVYFINGIIDLNWRDIIIDGLLMGLSISAAIRHYKLMRGGL